MYLACFCCQLPAPEVRVTAAGVGAAERPPREPGHPRASSPKSDGWVWGEGWVFCLSQVHVIAIHDCRYIMHTVSNR